MKPIFSIIIPTHNRPGKLQRALKSVALQNFPQLEVIIMNDASTEDYTEVIAEYSNIISSYHFLSENVGVSSARNKGIEIARGQWIIFLDDDDEYAEGHLHKLADYINENSLGSNDFIWCEIETRTYTERREGYRTSTIKPVFSEGRKVLLYESAMCIGASFGLTINAEVLAKIGHFDPSFKVGEDNDLIMRMLTAGVRPNYMASKGVIKHDHADGRLTGASYAIYSDLNIYEKLLEKHGALVDKYPLFSKLFVLWICVCHYRNNNYQGGDRMAQNLFRLQASKPKKLLYFSGIKTYKLFRIGYSKVSKLLAPRPAVQ